MASDVPACSLSVCQIFWMMGSILIIVLGMVLVPTLGWRWMIRLSVTPSIVLIFLFKVRPAPHPCILSWWPPRSGLTCLLLSPSLGQFIPESARYNVSAGNVQAAMETLQKIAQMNRACLPAGHLMEPVAVSF